MYNRVKNVNAKRPGTGITPDNWKVIGKKLNRIY